MKTEQRESCKYLKTRTENQTPHVLTHRWMLNNQNTWIQGGQHHTLDSVWGVQGGRSGGFGGWGGITWGEMPDVGDWGMEAATHIAMCVPM